MAAALRRLNTPNTDPIPILRTAFQLIEQYPSHDVDEENESMRYPDISVYTGNNNVFPTQTNDPSYTLDILTIRKSTRRNYKYIVFSEADEPVHVRTVDEVLNMIKHSFEFQFP
jgi:hypothetical protein